ncbi:YkuS family protein [Guptibacillus hwajinpoensis]|uniref:YkuS family protein n=1 Tax=Guptibacillus hwajinpoensis TaxID=208199 RepID=UPI0038500E4B
MKRIAVEDTLSDVAQALQAKGYEVVSLKQENDANGCDCCVVSGQDQNVMGMQNASTNGAVINADGMTADQVCQQVDSRYQ